MTLHAQQTGKVDRGKGGIWTRLRCYVRTTSRCSRFSMSWRPRVSRRAEGQRRPQAARHRAGDSGICHEAIEEQFFWPRVQHWLKEGRQLAAPALQQEQAAKRVLQELDKLEPGDPGFETLLARVISDAREHIAYE